MEDDNSYNKYEGQIVDFAELLRRNELQRQKETITRNNIRIKNREQKESRAHNRRIIPSIYAKTFYSIHQEHTIHHPQQLEAIKLQKKSYGKENTKIASKWQWKFRHDEKNIKIMHREQAILQETNKITNEPTVHNKVHFKQTSNKFYRPYYEKLKKSGSAHHKMLLFYR